MSTTFIIAEAGLNHNGKFELAKELVDKAVETGADAVKFQTFKNKRPELVKYELPYEDFTKLKEYCDKKGITFLSTPHTMDAIDFLDDLVPMFKVASPYLKNKEFLQKVASKGKPIILSTGSFDNEDGMATLEEVKESLSWIPDAEVILMHCVSKYPCEEPHYERIYQLKKLGKVVGLSDHSKNIKIPVVPYIEKHFMLKGVKCVDESVSMEPEDFKEMVEYIRKCEKS